MKKIFGSLVLTVIMVVSASAQFGVMGGAVGTQIVVAKVSYFGV